MARVSVIDRYGLQRVANNLLAPGPDGRKRNLGEITERLTELARKKAREENPDLAPSLLGDIAVTKQALLRYVERSQSAANRIINRNEAMATEAAEATINGLGTLLRVRKELWALWEAKKGDKRDADGKIILAKVDSLDAQRLLGRLSVVGKNLLELELLGMDPALFTRFLAVLDKGVKHLFGESGPEQLKAWLQDQDEFRDLAIALGWVKEDNEGSIQELPEDDTRMVN